MYLRSIKIQNDDRLEMPTCAKGGIVAAHAGLAHAAIQKLRKPQYMYRDTMVHVNYFKFIFVLAVFCCEEEKRCRGDLS